MLVEADDGKVRVRLDQMMDYLKAFPDDLAKELEAWQVEDMNRQYPNLDQSPEAVATSIWPRSRTYDQRNKLKAIKRIVRIRRQRSPLRVSKPVIASNRPILRPVLYDMLVERMNTLLQSKLGWKNTGD